MININCQQYKRCATWCISAASEIRLFTGNIYADELAEIMEQQSQILDQLLNLRGEIHIVNDLVESVPNNIK